MKIVILPTENRSRLHHYINDHYGLTDFDLPWKDARDLHIINKEEILTGDHVYDSFNNIVFKAIQHHKDILNTREEIYKVCLTTSNQLHDEGIQSIEDKFLNWFINNPSCVEVEVVSSPLLNTSRAYLGLNKYEIILPNTSDNSSQVTSKSLLYWKTNAEEEYPQTPISVLRYISELEKTT